MTAFTDAYNFRGRTLVDRDGEKIGTVEELYTDLEGGQPEWALVHTGMFGMKKSFVPLAGAAPTGEEIRVAVDKAAVKDAPKVDAGQELSEPQERELYEHYGMPYTTEGSTIATGGTAAGATAPGAAAASDAMGTGPAAGATGRDVSGPTTDDAMTRSEEELRVGVEQVERGRARLRKYVVTEEVVKRVPVRREEVRIEREPITGENVDAALSGPEISDEEHEVVLHEERPVVAKETVPKERVRLATDTVAGEQEVSEEVRKERIETDGVDAPGQQR
jgi:uncharacterized protein (TIGR02271 family)